jgi:isopentenyl diphosphate isomerase/L-lactate dehydrogenase-like FMN-dependent dehydrogenase
VDGELLNVWDYERAAAERLEEGPYSYFAGGANDELTLAENVAAYRRWLLRPRVLVDVSETSTATTVLGRELSMPILVAPVAFQRVVDPDGEVAMARAVAAAGTAMCLSTMATATWDEIAETGVPRWFQLYVPSDPAVAAEVASGAAEAGFSALVLTVDAPVLGRRERDHRTGFSIDHLLGLEWLQNAKLTPRTAFHSISPAVTWADVERFASLSGLPVVLKGVVTAEDARLACENGAAAVVVSNHGGRQLDGVAATIDALPEVADAIDGRIEVLVDGGIRRGSDVVKALALGARAVLVGRAPLWGLAVAGERGAAHVLGLLRAELHLALQLAGCRSPAEVTRSHVARAPSAAT